MTTRRRQLRERIRENRERRKHWLRTRQLERPWRDGDPRDRYLDRDGWPMSWRRYHYRRFVECEFVRRERWYGFVARTYLAPDVYVATSWLGEHSNTEGPPEIFESMVFGGPMAKHLLRYSSESAARIGHQLLCDFAQTVQRASRPPPER